MSKLDDAVLSAVRKVGPRAFTSAVFLEAVGLDAGLFGPSIGSVMVSLERLKGEGLVVETSAIDDKGRNRRAFTASNGRRRELGFGSAAPAFAFA